jgi:HicA toxin of bacterial toxin-antitoxin,
MSQIEKLIIRLLGYPRDFTWEELIKIFRYFGFNELKTGKTGGSRRKFVDGERRVISLHKPHPKNILKRYQIEDVIRALQEIGYLNE